MLFEAFSAATPENRILRRYTLDGHGYIFLFIIGLGKDRSKSPRYRLR
jgi:hypothetical protein